MWLLKNVDKGLTFRIKPAKSSIVSRKDGDLLLLEDQSISRKHAEVSIVNENKLDGVVLKDLGSKYGTFVVIGGGELTRVSPNEPVSLKNGDSIRFGIQWNIWRVEYFPLVVATSTLNTEEKAEVNEMVTALGGELAKDWHDSCTHLTMNKLTVTVKVVCALACGKPIVVPGYWKVLKEALATTEGKLPDCNDFVPPLAEALLNPSEVSFTPDPERAKLFSGYTFVASSSKQLARIKPMITAGGGTAVEFSAKSWPDSKLKDGKAILMQHTAGDRQGSQQSQVPDGYIAVARRLKAAGVRCVPESEIGLSILYRSMAQYCNPRFSRQLLGASASQLTQPITVICPDTEDSVKLPQDKVVASSSKKRALEGSGEEDQHLSKKSNSEDMFSSQSVQVDNNSNLPSTSVNKSDPKEKRPIVNPSLDMFAPSGQSDHNKNTVNKVTVIESSSDIRKARRSVVNPSVDMFAPSGQVSNGDNRNEVNPSCHDIFATNESRQMQDKKRANSNLPGTSDLPPKQRRVNEGDKVEDAFSFTTKNKQPADSRKPKEDKDDEFSFTSTRKSNKQPVIDEDDGDEFSFVSTKKGKNQKMGEKKEDEFSFVSSKNSKKRNRQSNSDMFDSNVKCAATTSKANRTVGNIFCNASSDDNEDLFAFPGGPASKKRKEGERDVDCDEPDAEIQLGLFSRKENLFLRPQNASEPVVLEDPPDEKHCVTYSKAKPCPIKVKEEVRDEEMDQLAQDLHNATIVVMKPLIVTKPKPVQVQPTSTGKNFKKFRKVMGMNKRAIPHIIGGSDLVPHYANCHNIDDILPPSPPRPTPDDDWGFVNEKKKGKNR